MYSVLKTALSMKNCGIQKFDCKCFLPNLSICTSNNRSGIRSFRQISQNSKNLFFKRRERRASICGLHLWFQLSSMKEIHRSWCGDVHSPAGRTCTSCTGTQRGRVMNIPPGGDRQHALPAFQHVKGNKSVRNKSKFGEIKTVPVPVFVLAWISSHCPSRKAAYSSAKLDV